MRDYPSINYQLKFLLYTFSNLDKIVIDYPMVILVYRLFVKHLPSLQHDKKIYSLMERNLRILLVDDHPLTIMGYKVVLKNFENGYHFEIEEATSCDEVLLKMSSYESNFFDIVLLDLNLPSSKDNLISDGEDLGLRIRSCFPYTKIIVHTGLSDQQRISTIFKSLRPEGFLIKSDIDQEVLFSSIVSVMCNNDYYSESINKLITSGSYDEMEIDSWDKKIIYHLSLGDKMKNLTEYIPFSIATIERRKKNLKILFGIPEGTTKQLLKIAKEKGFI